MEYQNPILKGDYSDPDVIRVGEDFYLISSSFTYIPGIPVLHSRDLVHWELIGYAASHLPFERYRRPAHRCGTWAPSLRYHNGIFYVYVCLPDEGLFALTRVPCLTMTEEPGWSMDLPPAAAASIISFMLTKCHRTGCRFWIKACWFTADGSTAISPWKGQSGTSGKEPTGFSARRGA